MKLCFDISSGGISAALFDSKLKAGRVAETRWKLETDELGAATLSIATVEKQFKRLIKQLKVHSTDAICIGSFMHNCLLLDDADEPLSPVFTWLDQRGEGGLEYVRSRLGDQFHERTGCRYHPMFPVFKLASMRLEKIRRVVSTKAFLLHRLTGRWIEDHGMASASGLFNIRKGHWDSELLTLVGLRPGNLPPVASRTEIIGNITRAAAVRFGLPIGTPVITGSGDGFLANVGSECEVPGKISITLGTSAVARQTLPRPVFNEAAGTFCYQGDQNVYLLGCAGSNGGNVLDWGRGIFGTLKDAKASDEPPIFIPLLHGERSPEWDPQLTGSWHCLTARHTAVDLSRSILEGVLFNLAYFVDIIHKTSGRKAWDAVLSGNGFLHPLAAPTLAAVAGLPVWMPRKPGLASLRGAGICGLRALGQPVPGLNPARVRPLKDPKILERYAEYRHFRALTKAEKT
jgi:gluconokinase